MVAFKTPGSSGLGSVFPAGSLRAPRGGRFKDPAVGDSVAGAERAVAANAVDRSAAKKYFSGEATASDLGGISVNHPKADVEIKAPVAPAVEASLLAPTGVDKAFALAERGQQFVGLAGIPLSLLPSAGRGMAKVGKAIGFSRMENTGGRFAERLEKLNTATFSDIGHATGLGGFFSRITKPVFDGIARISETILPDGFKGNRAAAHQGRAHTALQRAKGFAGKIDFADAPREAHGHLRTMQSAIADAHTMGHINLEKYNAASEAAKAALKEAEYSNTFAKNLGKLDGAMEKAIGHHKAAHTWNNLGNSIRDSHGALAKTSAQHAALNGVWIAGSGISMAQDAYGFRRKVKILKQMYAAMTGTDVNRVSTLKVLLGNVPEPVRMARSNILKMIGISEGADALGMATNIKGARKNSWGGISGLLVYMIPGWISDAAGSALGPSILPIYEQLNQNFKAGKPIVAEEYAELIALASKDLKSRGAADAFTQAVAAQYAAEKANPVTVLKEASDGTLMKRISLLVAANESAAEKPHTEPEKSHVAELNGAQPQREVIGKHTGNVARESPAPAISPA